MLKKTIIAVMSVNAFLYTTAVHAAETALKPEGDAVSACIAHDEGESCWYRDGTNEPVHGKCRKSDERHKSCTKITD